MAELHIIGQINSLEVQETTRGTASFYCDYRLVFGEGWAHLEGSFAGRTQTTRDRIEPRAIWNHPLDSHLITKTFQSESQHLYGISVPKTHYKPLINASTGVRAAICLAASLAVEFRE